MKNKLLVFAGLFGSLGVIFGAFGAHALKAILTQQALGNWQTAVQYQFIHSLALLFLSAQTETKQIRLASWFFISGILLFSGSLYLLSLREIFAMPLSFLGPITPIGGLFFTAGWLILLFSGLKKS